MDKRRFMMWRALFICEADNRELYICLGPRLELALYAYLKVYWEPKVYLGLICKTHNIYMFRDLMLKERFIYFK